MAVLPCDTTVVDRLDTIIELLEEGGSGGLPEVDSDDNGKVLTVVEGEWAAANPSGGGGGILSVTVADNSAESCLYLNKTYTEIIDAISNHYSVQFFGPLASTVQLAAFSGFAFCSAAWSPILEEYTVTLTDLGDTYWEDLFPDDNGVIRFTAANPTDTLKATYTST